MDDLINVVRKLLRSENVVIVGIGNILRGDDGVGIIIAKRLKKLLKDMQNIYVVICEAGFENITHILMHRKPKHLLIIDAVYVENGEPGSIYVFTTDELSSYPSITTHHLPLKLVLDYLIHHLKMEVIIVGIQVKNIELGGRMSREVLNAGRYIINLFQDVIKQLRIK